MASIINASNSGFGGIVSTGDSSGVLQLQAAGTTVATIQSTGLNLGSNGVVFSDSSTQTAAASPYVLKNRIINGDMRIDQRNAGASVTNLGAGAFNYTLDRWAYYATQASKFTIQQNAGSVTPPAGFNNYLGVTSTSAYSNVSSDIFLIEQPIEGFNTADLGWGTVNAKTVTISFWVRSSLTGTFGGVIGNSAQNRSYPFTYTISAANTWELKSVTIAGDTTGTWVGATNGIGMYIYLNIGSGSTYQGTAGAWAGAAYFSATGATSLVGTNGATFYITGVQLEIGTSATPFERRLYGQELINCQRYFVKTDTLGNGVGVNANVVTMITQMPVTMRGTPTVAVGGTTWQISDNYAADQNTSSPTISALYEASTTSIRVAFSGFSSLTGGRFYNWRPSTTSLINISAEL